MKKNQYQVTTKNICLKSEQIYLHFTQSYEQSNQNIFLFEQDNTLCMCSNKKFNIF